MYSYQCEAVKVKMGVPQGSPVSPILFAVYLSQKFKEVEEDIEGYIVISYVNNCRWLVMVDSVAQIYERLERA